MDAPQTLYDKIWNAHIVYKQTFSQHAMLNDSLYRTPQKNDLDLIYVDRHLLHEVSSPPAFSGLRAAGRSVRRPDCTLATVDHNVPTSPRNGGEHDLEVLIADPESRAQCSTLEDNVKEFSLPFFGLHDKRQGIVHVIGPEQGFTLPGITCVCGDSHTSTHGAFGALAFGIGSTEVEHVLATQTLLQRKSKNMRISVDGELGVGVTSKDLILHIIGVIGASGGNGYVIEYAGSVIRGLSMEARMSVCNMSIEAGARAGMIAPDDITFAYLKNRPLAPQGDYWERAVEFWRTLRSDIDAKFDVEVNIHGIDVVPCVTWGTSPQDVVPITGVVPDPACFADQARRQAAERSLHYMGLIPGTAMQDIKVDNVFIGSCTNGRIEDLRAAANVIRSAGPSTVVSSGVQCVVVPGSTSIRLQAESEGLHTVFRRAGFQWRESGCSMCIAMNGDQLEAGKRCASTTNRNFEGRQGAGGRTHLMSPAMAAATALRGTLTDPRQYQSQTTETNVEFEDNIKSPATIPELPAMAPAISQQVQKKESKIFRILQGIAAPMYLENTDTDMIIPKQFLKRIDRQGLADALFFNLRHDSKTGASLDFILDRPPYNKAVFLISTGKNFGCGSSRENAAWSLEDFGIRCLIAPSFGDIFRNNCFQNCMLPIELSVEECRSLAADAELGIELKVDLEKQEIIRMTPSQNPIKFLTDAFRRQCLLEGFDEIGTTMQLVHDITAFEEKRTQMWPWLDGMGRGRKVQPYSDEIRMDW
ncbi:3-isopropylmalate dehydratase [Mycena indigotica]|uniref:3-isopropylmalate dehydratase n=1 Tax=Mycena indigotica TaxID=2126181 RepID=A0A8H6S288_9AGAR|nr:3-isopropylmalate dehydratase [Mycena indigotica]KAF7291890.1 3-isopropylmalate dehydratase [Mycena indigotica]